MNKFYARILHSNVLRLHPKNIKDNSYFNIIKDANLNSHSLILATLSLNIFPIILTTLIDLSIYFLCNEYWAYVIAHVPLAFMYCLNFNLFKNWELSIFVIILLLISLFLIKYWLLTWLICAVGITFIYDLFSNC